MEELETEVLQRKEEVVTAQEEHELRVQELMAQHDIVRDLETTLEQRESHWFEAQKEHEQRVQEMKAEHHVECIGLEAVQQRANEEGTKSKQCVTDLETKMTLQKEEVAKAHEEHERCVEELLAQHQYRVIDLETTLAQERSQRIEAQAEHELRVEEITAQHHIVLDLETTLEQERTQWLEAYETLDENVKIANEKTAEVQAELQTTQRRIEKTKQVFAEERTTWDVARSTFEEVFDTAKSSTTDTYHDNEFVRRDREAQKTKKAMESIEQEATRIQGILEQELDQKQQHVDALEETIHQLEKIIAIQTTKAVEEKKERADRDAVAIFEEVVETVKCTADNYQKNENEFVRRDRESEAQKTTKAEMESIEEESTRIQHILEQELERKQQQVDALEESVTHLEKMLSIQTKAIVEEGQKEQQADRDASAIATTSSINSKSRNDDNDDDEDSSVASSSCTFGAYRQQQQQQQNQQSSPPSYQQQIEASTSINSHRSIDLTSSNLTADSASASYYSWVEKVQETHNTEKRQLLRGMLTHHLRCQNANHHVGQLLGSSRAALEAIDQDSNSIFGDCLLHYTAISVAAKRYMDGLVARTGRDDMLEIQDVSRSLTCCSNNDLEFMSSSESGMTTTDEMEDSMRSYRSVALTANPWLRNAPLWEQVWSSLLLAKTSPFQLCQTALLKVCSGIIPSTTTTTVQKGAEVTTGPSIPLSTTSPLTSTWGLSSLFLYRTPPPPPGSSSTTTASSKDTTNTTEDER